MSVCPTPQSVWQPIPMLVDRSADEKTDLAKAEWLKVYGVIFGCEDQANELFQQMVKAEENK